MINSEATIKTGALEWPFGRLFVRIRALLIRLVFIIAVIAVAGVGWGVRGGALYKSGAGVGYALGLGGGAMMLILLLYPLRKRLRFMQGWGALKHWFKLHMLGGVLGPVLVLFHSTFRVGSLNAGVALACMFLVVASGIVGRFLYRKIHHGLYGSQATLEELRQALEKEFKLLEPHLKQMPTLKLEVERFAELAARAPSGWYDRAGNFLSLGWKRVRAQRRVRRLVRKSVPDSGSPAANVRINVLPLLRAVDSTLRAAQRTAQFSAYEKLFSLWHVVHIPFLCMLVITAIIHVVAVHAY